MCVLFELPLIHKNKNTLLSTGKNLTSENKDLRQLPFVMLITEATELVTNFFQLYTNEGKILFAHRKHNQVITFDWYVQEKLYTSRLG